MFLFAMPVKLLFSGWVVSLVFFSAGIIWRSNNNHLINNNNNNNGYSFQSSMQRRRTPSIRSILRAHVDDRKDLVAFGPAILIGL